MVADVVVAALEPILLVVAAVDVASCGFLKGYMGFRFTCVVAETEPDRIQHFKGI
jgi:hypothetical protein